MRHRYCDRHTPVQLSRSYCCPSSSSSCPFSALCLHTVLLIAFIVCLIVGVTLLCVSVVGDVREEESDQVNGAKRGEHEVYGPYSEQSLSITIRGGQPPSKLNGYKTFGVISLVLCLIFLVGACLVVSDCTSPSSPSFSDAPPPVDYANYELMFPNNMAMMTNSQSHNGNLCARHAEMKQSTIISHSLDVFDEEEKEANIMHGIDNRQFLTEQCSNEDMLQVAIDDGMLDKHWV